MATFFDMLVESAGGSQHTLTGGLPVSDFKMLS